MSDLSTTPLERLRARRASWENVVETGSQFAALAPKIVAALTAEIDRREAPPTQDR